MEPWLPSPLRVVAFDVRGRHCAASCTFLDIPINNATLEVYIRRNSFLIIHILYMYLRSALQGVPVSVTAPFKLTNDGKQGASRTLFEGDSLLSSYFLKNTSFFREEHSLFEGDPLLYS